MSRQKWHFFYFIWRVAWASASEALRDCSEVCGAWGKSFNLAN